MNHDKIPDIYKAFALFAVLLCIWLYRPEDIIANMLSTAFGAVLGFLTSRRVEPTTIVEDSKTTVINSAKQDQGSK